MDQNDVDFESLLNICRKEVRRVILPHASFLSEIPNQPHIEYKGERLYSPALDFFNLIILNVALPLIVSVAASALYERIFSKRTKILSKEEIQQAVIEIIELSKESSKGQQGQENTINLANSKELEEDALELGKGILITHGWPLDDATKDIEKAADCVREFIQKYKTGQSDLLD